MDSPRTQAARKLKNTRLKAELTKPTKVVQSVMPLGPPGFTQGVIGRAEIQAANATKAAGGVGKGLGYAGEGYKTSIRVRVHHGGGLIHDDEIKGLSKAHAMWRAAINWAHAVKIERLP